MNGSYEEGLKTGGKLIVNKDSWHIQYYFPGPDLRYNGTFLSLDGNRIDDYISAWKENFEKCKKLEKEVPSNGNYNIEGIMGMYIHVNNGQGFVTLDSWHFSINKEYELRELLNDYLIAKAKAKIIMKLLSEIANININLDEISYEKPQKREGNSESVLQCYTDDDIALAYNLLLPTDHKPFTKRKALKLFEGKFDESILYKLKEVGLVMHNEKDDDWEMEYLSSISNNKNGVYWYIKYQLKQCDPLIEKVLELYLMKHKTDFEYIEEKLDISHQRMVKIKNEINELCSLDSYLYSNKSDLYETLVDRFYTFKPLNVKNAN